MGSVGLSWAGLGWAGLVWDSGGPTASEKMRRTLGGAIICIFHHDFLWLWAGQWTTAGVGKVIFVFLFRLPPYLRGYNIRGHTHDDIPTAESDFLCLMDRSWLFVHGPGRYDDMHANLISWGFLKGAAALALLGCGFRIASWLGVLGKTPAIGSHARAA